MNAKEHMKRKEQEIGNPEAVKVPEGLSREETLKYLNDKKLEYKKQLIAMLSKYSKKKTT